MVPVLEVEGLSISFTQYEKGVHQHNLPVIRNLDLTIQRGQVVAVVGSSGSGKSLLAHGILGILPYNAHMEGQLRYCGQPLTQKRVEALRGNEIVLVPQAVSYLDPLMKVAPQVSQDGTRARVALNRYGLGPEIDRLYPFELSGGMARRVLISTAVAQTPSLVIADEPTSGIDARAATRIMSHFRELADNGAALLLITHDLELALTIADRVAVFYAGETVEEAPAADFQHPEALRHPYTRALWRAMPQNGFVAISGSQPNPGEIQEGCVFRPRCPYQTQVCGGTISYQRVAGGHVRCCHPERRELG